MNYRLGLDLGTNSIGWAVLEIKDDDRVRLEDAGVRVFPDGRKPKTGEPLAVQRRLARAARRQRDRRLRRQRLVMAELIRAGYLPADRADRKAWLHSTVSQAQYHSIEARRKARTVFERVFKVLGRPLLLKRTSTEVFHHLNPYYLRSAAIDRKLDPYELGRVLMHLALHRGFKSNRKTDASDDENPASTYERIASLRAQITESGCRTLGEFLWRRYQAGEPVRFRPGQSEFYPDRQLYRDEFETIRREQSKHHPSLNWDRLAELIYYQRPLHPQERGRCRYYNSERRAYADQPSAARFRVLQEVNNLSFIDSGGAVVTLSDSEKDEVANRLSTAKTVSFDAVRKMVHRQVVFNLEDERRSKLLGDEVSFHMSKPGAAGPLWTEIDPETQDAIVERMHESDSNDALADYLRDTLPGLSDDQYATICRIPLSSKTSAVSARFARECNAIMEQQHVGYVEAARQLGFAHHEIDRGDPLNELPYYGQVLTRSVVGADPSATEPEKKYGRISNVTVHIALNQLRKIVNALIARYGKPGEIVVELGRDLKLSQEKLRSVVSEQSKNQKKNDRISDELRSLGVASPSRADVLKYELWEELGTDQLARCCIYCGRPISAKELISDGVEVEHILPYSRTLLTSKSNLTVSHKSCNNAKGNRSPYEAFHGNTGGYDYVGIMQRVRTVFKFNRRKRRNFAEDAMQEFHDVESFLIRQQTDNAYIARAAKEYLGCICDPNRIWPTVGRLTAEARRQWGLDTILAKKERIGEALKNRTDHRHHAIDAIAASLTTRSLLHRVATASAKNTEPRYKNRLKFPSCPVPRERIAEVVSTIIPSIRVNHAPEGRLFEETAVGAHQFPNVEKDPTEDGKLWAYRKPITALSAREIESAIVDPVLRNAVQHYVSNYAALKLSDALAKFAEETGIRRVRVVAHSQEPTIIGSAPYKAYYTADVLYCEVWMIASGKKVQYKGVFWRRAEATKRLPGEDRRPHPAAKKLMRLYKQDTIALGREGEKTYAVVHGFGGGPNKFDVRPVYCAGGIATWKELTQPELTSWPLRTSPRENYESINAVFSKFHVSKCRITPDGRVFGR